MDNDGVRYTPAERTALGFDASIPIATQNPEAAEKLADRYGGRTKDEFSGLSPVKKKPNLNLSNGGALVSQGIQFAQSIGQSYGDVSSRDELMANAGTVNAQGSGFDYQKYNDIDRSAEFRKLSKENTTNTFKTMGTGAALGGTIGSVVPGVGNVIGAAAGAVIGGVVGLFGSKHRRSKLRKRMFNAQQSINAANNYNQSSAQTDYLQQDYLQQYGNTQDDVIYGARHGKDLKQPIVKYE